MEQDEIIKEVRANREAYSERFGFDIQALYRDAKAREGSDGRTVVSFEPKRVEMAAAGYGEKGQKQESGK